LGPAGAIRLLVARGPPGHRTSPVRGVAAPFAVPQAPGPNGARRPL